MARKLLKAFRLALALICLLLAAACCRGIKDIELNSVRLASVSLHGFSSADLTLELGIDNPAKKVEIKDFVANVRDGEDVILTLESEYLLIEAAQDKLYSVPVRASLAEGAEAMRLIRLLGSQEELEGLVADVEAKLSYNGGFTRTVRQKDLSVKELVENL